jgi:hypothetical protein
MVFAQKVLASGPGTVSSQWTFICFLEIEGGHLLKGLIPLLIEKGGKGYIETTKP